MSYIDGVVCAVPTLNKEKFVAHARASAALFKEVGATRVVENWGSDVPDGKVTDLKRAVQATAEETVVFSWVAWPDKSTRDAGWAKLMQDPRMQKMDMPYDGKRMIFGGFEGVLEV